MIDPVATRLWLYRGAYVAAAVAVMFLRLLPIGPGAGTWPGPDLLLCLTLAWATRRPDQLPAGLIAAVFLAEDLLAMRPPGLWAGLVVLACEFLRARAALTRELVFLVEWFLVGLVVLALLAANRLLLALAMLDQTAFGPAFAQAAMTILCYPLAVGVLRLALDLRKPSAGEVDALGRRL